MGNKNREKRLIYNILKYVNSLPECYAYKRMGSVHNRGEPDISGIVSGMRLELEVKVKGNYATKLQLHCVERWRKLGAISAVVYTLDEVKALLKPLVREPRAANGKMETTSPFGSENR